MIGTIAQREFWVRSRQRGTHWIRLGSAGGAVLVVLLVELLGGLQDGRGPFQFLGGALYFFLLFEGLRQTADVVSRERREGTLGLLFLTDLRGFDVVFGKLAASCLPLTYSALAMAPVFGLLLLIGGVSGGEFVRLIGALFAGLAIAMSLGIWISARCREAGAAFGGAVMVLVVWSLVSLLQGMPGNGVVFLPSPVTLYASVFDVIYQARPQVYWGSLGFLLILSVGLIGLAGWRLERRWQDLPSGTVRSQIPRVARPGCGLFPLQWLAERSGLHVHVSLFILLVGALSGVGARWMDTTSWLGIAMVWGLTGLVAWYGVRVFSGEERRERLELLLTTPVGASEMTQQLSGAARRVAVLGFFLSLGVAVELSAIRVLRAFWASGEPLTRETIAALARELRDRGQLASLPYLWGEGCYAVFLAASVCLWLYGVYWVGLWRGSGLDRPLTAWWRTMGIFLLMIFLSHLLLFVGSVILSALSGPRFGPVEPTPILDILTLVARVGTTALVLVLMARHARKNLEASLRDPSVALPGFMPLGIFLPRHARRLPVPARREPGRTTGRQGLR